MPTNWEIAKYIGRYAGGGLLSYATPRFLVAIGVPLDQWIVMAGNLAHIQLTSGAALWIATVLIGALLFGWSHWPSRKPSTSVIKSSVEAPAHIEPEGVIVPARRDVKMHEALAFVETGKWGGKFYGVVSQPSKNPDKGFSPTEVRQAAIDGNIRIWGRQTPNDAYVLIKRDYWEEWQLEWFSALKSSTNTEKAVTNAKGSKYYDLMVSKVEFEARWPPHKQALTLSPAEQEKALELVRRGHQLLSGTPANILVTSQHLLFMRKWDEEVEKFVLRVFPQDEVFGFKTIAPSLSDATGHNAREYLAKRLGKFRLIAMRYVPTIKNEDAVNES